MRRKNRNIVAYSIVGLFALAPVLMATVPANASPASPSITCAQALACPKFSGTGVNIRKNPIGSGGATTILGEGQTGQEDAVNQGSCDASEGGDAWWDFGTDRSTGITGWAADEFVSHFSQDLFGPCG